MAKTRIFLSSTCYDLRALREHLREKIEESGHELLASEFSSFPISPDLSTVENCKKAIRDHADLLVLVVGGKRGSLDATGMKSVVNAEYLEARAKGLDSFVFVEKQVWDLLPIYEKNPSVDFSPTVDHPEVFKFVASLKAESRWIYTFTKTEEIITTLRTQLSVFLRTLIERGRAGTLLVPKDFVFDPPEIIQIIQERPRFWEHLLTCELLERVVIAARKQMTELKSGFIFRKTEVLSEEIAFNRLSRIFQDLINIAGAFEHVIGAVTASWGPIGVSGDPVEIRRACGRIDSLIQALVEWETDLHFIQVPDRCAPLFDALQGSTIEFIEEIARAPQEIRRGLEIAKVTKGTHHMEIQLVIRDPSSLKKFNEELAKLRRQLI